MKGQSKRFEYSNERGCVTGWKRIFRTSRRISPWSRRVERRLWQLGSCREFHRYRND